jgi:hypothetical protein
VTRGEGRVARRTYALYFDRGVVRCSHMRRLHPKLTVDDIPRPVLPPPNENKSPAPAVVVAKDAIRTELARQRSEEAFRKQLGWYERAISVHNQMLHELGKLNKVMSGLSVGKLPDPKNSSSSPKFATVALTPRSNPRSTVRQTSSANCG